MREPGKIEFYVDVLDDHLKVRCPRCGDQTRNNLRIVTRGEFMTLDCYACESNWFTWTEEKDPLRVEIVFPDFSKKPPTNAEYCAMLNSHEWEEFEWMSKPKKSRLDLLRES